MQTHTMHTLPPLPDLRANESFRHTLIQRLTQLASAYRAHLSEADYLSQAESRHLLEAERLLTIAASLVYSGTNTADLSDAAHALSSLSASLWHAARAAGLD